MFTPIGHINILHMINRLFAVAMIGMALQVGAAATEPENVPEAVGFWGQVTGTVKSAQDDGRCFVLVVSKAEVDPAASALKDSAPMVGKELEIGVRMPRKKTDGVASPHADDVAYIKTLKPGMVITVTIFAPRSNPKVLRIQEPGKTVTAADQPPQKEKTIKFIDTVGEFPIPATAEIVRVTEIQSLIQFRIRGVGPVEPVIQKNKGWFIAVVDKDHVWVHLGAGRLFYYSWQSETQSRVDEWTYPNLGDAKLPKEVEDRLRK